MQEYESDFEKNITKKESDEEKEGKEEEEEDEGEGESKDEMQKGEKEKKEKKEKEEGKELQRFRALLKEVEEGAALVVRDNNGVINPEAAIRNRVSFINEARRISRIAEGALDILEKAPYADGIGPLIANTSFGRICTAGNPRYAGGYNNISDFEHRALPDSKFTEDLKEKWVDFLQDFFDDAQKMTENFESYDELNEGKLSKAINSLG